MNPRRENGSVVVSPITSDVRMGLALMKLAPPAFGAFSSDVDAVRIKKTRQNESRSLRSDPIGTCSGGSFTSQFWMKRKSQVGQSRPCRANPDLSQSPRGADARAGS